ncbi:MAG: single-stranded-DNA-specific exonuclease RecJ [Ruminococcaceae bacterium]|nr:single-stranded-DNA-specific exonuclease RecJ [Oscillospiraceae bacterium]
MKKWIIREYDEGLVEELEATLGLQHTTAVILANRGIKTCDEAVKFLNKRYNNFFNAFIMKDMKTAVDRIIKAVHSREKVMIYGDYDVDGVTSTTVLYKYLCSIGANAEYYIPSRTGEGYGLNDTVIKSFSQRGGKLIITVDTGITALDEVRFALDCGVDTIVTDHHECREVLPDACAVINPKRPDCKYPFKELAGVGVVFKLLCALDEVFFARSALETVNKICDEYGDLVAIGTIADVMPIMSENRVIVGAGLERIEHTANLGLKALIEESGVNNYKGKSRKITSAAIGFIIAPRINAAGRIGNAVRAVELFLADDIMLAKEIAQELCATNKQRQLVENDIIEGAVAKIEQEHDFEHDRVIILDDDTWHHGVIGIVASRLTERYNLPSILISFKNEGIEGGVEIGKGSGRSIKGLDLNKALTHCSDLLMKYGGHELAAGLSIERANLAAFKKKINDYARSILTPEMLTKTITIDCEIRKDDVNFKTMDEINALEPYGCANPVPLLYFSGASIVSITPLAENKHTKLLLQNGDMTINALFFGMPSTSLKYLAGDRVDIACNLDINNFQNQKQLQFIIRDIRLSSSLTEYFEFKKQAYLKCENDSACPINQLSIPGREDFKDVYSALCRLVRTEGETVDLTYVCRMLSQKSPKRFDLHKLFIAVDVLDELGIITCSAPEGGALEIRNIRINPYTAKTPLDNSSKLRAMRARASDTVIE